MRSRILISQHVKVVEWISLKRNPIPILLSVLILAIVGLSLVAVPVAASGAGTWKTTTGYGNPVTATYGPSCVVSGGYVYCVGGDTSSGLTSAVYYARLLSSGGLSTLWWVTTPYLTPIITQCVVHGAYIYCVGGSTTSVVTSAVYFAKLSSSGVGTWNTVTGYPTPIDAQSCVVSGSYIYCVGGNTGSADTRSVYFAPLSSSGVGVWKKTTPYPTPVEAQSCVVHGAYIYCVGGSTTSVVTGYVYFASLSSSGVGTWKSTTNNYPINIAGQRCVLSGSYVYCVGGFRTTTSVVTSAVYFAKLSSSAGVGTWKSTTSYPTHIGEQSCVVSGGYVYCAGGFNGVSPTSAVYFASV